MLHKLTSFAKEIGYNNRKAVDVGVDGDCQFRVIADQVLGNPELFREMRAAAVAYLSVQKDEMVTSLAINLTL